MKREIIQRERDGTRLELIISSRGNCFCPVCGAESENPEWRPYDENGYGNHDICQCGFQFGYTMEGISPVEKGWEEFRLIWFHYNEKAGFKWLGKKTAFDEYLKQKQIEKEKQLLNIGVKINQA